MVDIIYIIIGVSFLVVLGSLIGWGVFKIIKKDRKKVLNVFKISLAIFIIAVVAGSIIPSTEKELSAQETTSIEEEQEDSIEIESEEKEDIMENNQFGGYKIRKANVMNGSKTEKIGERGYIRASISDISEINTKDLKEFYNMNIKDNNYNWFNIFLADGNALTFTAGRDMTISYGPTDEEGAIISEQIGLFMITDDEENPYEYFMD